MTAREPGERAGSGALTRLFASLVLLVSLALPVLRAEQIPEIESSLTEQSSRFKLGTMALFVYGSAGVGLDDNVFLTPTSRRSAAFLFAVPGVRARRPEDNHNLTLQVDYQGRAREFFGQGNVNHGSYMEHQFAVQGTWKPSRTQTWDFGENAAYLIEPVSPTIPRAERFENAVNATDTVTGRTTDFTFNGSFNVLRFANRLFQPLNNDSINLGVGVVYHDLGPKAQIVADYNFAYYNLRDRSRSDFVVHSLLGGIATPLGENQGWVYGAKVGGVLMESVSNLGATGSSHQLVSFAIAASASWSQSDPNTYFRMTLSNVVQPSDSFSATFANVYSFLARGQYAYNRYFRAGGELGYQWVEDIGTHRDISRLNMRISLSYHPTETLSFFGRVEYRERFAHLLANRYEDVRILGGATYVF